MRPIALYGPCVPPYGVLVSPRLLRRLLWTAALRTLCTRLWGNRGTRTSVAIPTDRRSMDPVCLPLWGPRGTPTFVVTFWTAAVWTLYNPLWGTRGTPTSVATPTDRRSFDYVYPSMGYSWHPDFFGDSYGSPLYGPGIPPHGVPVPVRLLCRLIWTSGVGKLYHLQRQKQYHRRQRHY